MNLAKISIKHPAFIVSVMLALVAVGLASFKAMGVDLFPNTSIPIVSVMTVYPGAGPSEIETLVSKPLEEKISSIAGLKRLSSKSLEGLGIVTAEFYIGMDVEKLEQTVRDKVAQGRGDLPRAVEEPVIRRYDPSDQPMMELTVKADLPPAALFDLADQVIRPKLEQVNSVASVEIYGGRKREIQVLLDRRKLAASELSASQVAGQVGASGENIPSGKVNVGPSELSFRGLGEFESVSQVADVLVNLYGDERATKVGAVGRVVDTLADEKNRTYVGETPALFLYVYRQSGTSMIEVADGLKRAVADLNARFKQQGVQAQVGVLTDASGYVKENVEDVYETIALAILLTVVTVYFFLGSLRATLITALVLPVSLFGSFILMSLAGFSINVISLMALSLAVGLLVDDAIVVIENIFRRIAEGETPLYAAEQGTREIQVSVFAITLVVISVFLPVGFMGGLVGQFFKQFGLTLVFAMAISLGVALTLIPMLTGYFESKESLDAAPAGPVAAFLLAPVRAFDRFQGWLEGRYAALLGMILRRPVLAATAGLGVFILSLAAASRVPQAFAPEMDHGEVVVELELAPGASLDGTELVALQVERVVKANANVALVALTVGGQNGEANKAELFVRLKSGAGRGGSTGQFKEKLRHQLEPFAVASPWVKDYDPSSGLASQPFVLNLMGTDSAELEAYAAKLMAFMQKDPRLKDVMSSSRPGKPEFRVKLTDAAANTFGVNSKTMGMELRAQVEGFTPAKFREQGKEYDIRVRLQEDQRNLRKDFQEVLVPNVNHRLVRLADVTKSEDSTGPAVIDRQDRGRRVQITADLAQGAGLSDVVKQVEGFMARGEGKVPSSIRLNWAGDVENMKESGGAALVAVAFGVVFIYLILASLYGSFVTPATILVALPLALSGAFFALFITGKTMNIFVILGIFMLLGIAGKNSILLVDFANQGIAEGLTRAEAMLRAGKARLRPILMTSFALISGTLPVAMGVSEAARPRAAMGWAIIGGVISSTALTLVVVPAIFSYMDRYRIWSKAALAKRFLGKQQ